ncbi:MAG: hypothetical protein RML35_14865 [Chloroherpetonaceae bacterium]|nr:hypothetical protein [Chloroherpetonaceae bacterium]
MRKHNGIAKRLATLLLGAALLAGCVTTQGGFVKPSQLRCACGLALGHAGAHAYTISDFIKAKQAHTPQAEQLLEQGLHQSPHNR